MSFRLSGPVPDHISLREMFLYPNKPLRIYDIDRLFQKINPKDWLVQPKWDGHRALPACDKKGKVMIFSRHGTLLTLGRGKFKWLADLDLPKPWLLDGELTRSGRLILWDYAILGGTYQIGRPYEERLKELSDHIMRPMVIGGNSLEIIQTRPSKGYKEILLQRSQKELEGFVLKRKNAENLWGVHRTTEVGSQIKYRFD